MCDKMRIVAAWKVVATIQYAYIHKVLNKCGHTCVSADQTLLHSFL